MSEPSQFSLLGKRRFGPVPVVPMALQNLWGSFFSRYSGTAFLAWPRKFWSRIGLIAGEAIPADAISAAYLQGKVTELRGDAP